MEIKCKWQKKIYKKNNFSIAEFFAISPAPLFLNSSSQIFVAKGLFLPNDNICEYVLYGEFKTEYVNNSSRTTFEVRSCKELLPSTADNTKKYLQKIKGIGKASAEKMYDKFGPNIWEIISNSPTLLCEIKGISEQKAFIVQEDFLKKQHGIELFAFLNRFKISESITMKLLSIYGSEAYSMIRQNPYILSNKFKVTFKTANKLAQSIKFFNNDLKLEAMIIEVLKQNQYGGELFNSAIELPPKIHKLSLRDSLYKIVSQSNYEFASAGNTCINSDLLYLQVLRLNEDLIPENVFLNALRRMFSSKKIYLRNDLANSRYIVYLLPTASAEFRSAAKIANLLKANPMDDVANIDFYSALNFAEKFLSIKLSPEQENAVVTALSNPISVITGGPGTGKTSVLKALIVTYSNLFPQHKIALAAPTGRASKRMSEATGFSASTLHSLFSIYEDALEDRLSSSPLDVNLLIIDESSMIDIFLLDSILNAIKLGTKIVFVGDIDQLPSVNAGAVLRSIIDSKVIPVTKLSLIFRQESGSTIALNSRKIRTGETNLEYSPSFEFIETKNSQETIDCILNIYPSLVKKYGVDEVALLTAFRRHTVTGADSLNEILQRKIITPSDISFKRNNCTFYIGDKVMYQKNYKSIANGDIGTILDIKRQNNIDEVKIDFGGNEVALLDSELNQLTLAYASTVHKAQGSEYDVVIQIIDEKHKKMLRRNLVYTGITRAKEKMILIGDKQVFENAILHEDSTMRYSLLDELIKLYFTNDCPTPLKKESEEQISLSLD